MLILLMVAALSGEPGPSAISPAPPSVVTVPDWRRKATGGDLMKVYPSRALRRGISGAAIIRCSVNKVGVLVDCSVEDEGPPGEGLGEAALKLMPRFVMRPMTKDGVPVDGGAVRVPIRFMTPR